MQRKLTLILLVIQNKLKKSMVETNELNLLDRDLLHYQYLIFKGNNTKFPHKNKESCTDHFKNTCLLLTIHKSIYNVLYMYYTVYIIV